MVEVVVLPPFDREDQRYEYPLDDQSVVLDVGAYRGAFTQEIYRRYGCRIFAFEPVPEFCDTVKQLASPRIRVFQYGLAGTSGPAIFSVAGDMTGRFHSYPANHPQRVVQLVNAATVFRELTLDRVDLMKINVEGEEYHILEHMLEHNLLPRVRYLQVQFHRLPGSNERYAKLAEGIAVTHALQWRSEYVWESWKRK